MAKAKDQEQDAQVVDEQVATEEPAAEPEKKRPASSKKETLRIKNPQMAHNHVYAVTGKRIEFDGNGVSGELDQADFNQLKKISGYQRA